MKNLENGQIVKIQSGSEILTGKVISWKSEKSVFGVEYDNGNCRKFSRKTGKVYGSSFCLDKVIFEYN